ncbi:SARP family transcriptional regulator [Asanoa siamensis]|uniref:SARP family transcriptional regulator n=1 Tax=Asanoa siamensis TaxID=926357 RepID=A0ABQ4CXF8_9ACTN|nr:SARP family transcriptional regulator [Asanoa siamensis]
MQSRISEVRATLAAVDQPDAGIRLLTSGSGYVLEAPPDRVDAHRFRDDVAAVRDAVSDEQARALVRSALSLWRGPVLDGWLHPNSRAALGQGLEELRLTATEELFDIELRLGNHLAIVDELGELARAHPTRERLVGHLMLALARSGRSAEALQAFDKLRRWLRDELGTDPSTELQSLHVAVVRGEIPALQAISSEPADTFPAAVPRTLPADVADFSGRSRETAELRGILVRESVSARVAAVTGPAGAGKTALSIHVAHALSNEFPDGQLYANLHGIDTGRPDQPGQVLDRFLRALGVDGLSLPATLDGRVDLYRGLLADRRLIVLLDNAVDEEQILPLIPGSGSCAVIVTSRTRLGAAVGAETVALEVMDSAEAIELLARIAGTARVSREADASQELVRWCGHLPLAIRIAGSRLAAKPHWTMEKLSKLLSDERSRLDRLSYGHLDVRASIELSYRSLSPQAQILLRLLGGTDTVETSIWLASALLGSSAAAAEEALEELIDAQLLDFAGPANSNQARYRLHDLVRLFAKERDDRADLVDEAKVRVYGAALSTLDRLFNAMYGQDSLTMHSSSPRQAIDDPQIRSSPASLMEWFDAERPVIIRLVEWSAKEGLSGVAWDLACTSSPLFAMHHLYDDWSHTLDIALTATRRSDDIRGQAATLYRFGMLHTDRQEMDQAKDMFVQAAQLFKRAGDDHGQAVITAYLAMIHRFQRRPEEALLQYATAIDGLEAAGDRGGVAFVLRGLGQASMDLGDDVAADTHLARSLSIYREIGSPPLGLAQALFWYGMLLLRRDAHEKAEPLFAEVLATARTFGDRHGQAQALRGLGICHYRSGKRERAHADLTEALHLVRQTNSSIVEARVQQTIEELFPNG